MAKSDEEKKIANDMNNMMEDLFGNIQDMGAPVQQPQFDVLNKAVGHTRTGMAELGAAAANLTTRFEDMAKVNLNPAGDIRPKGALFSGSDTEMYRVLNGMVERQGKLVQFQGKTTPYAEQMASREYGYDISDIKQIRRMAERGALGQQYTESFGYIRGTDLEKRAVQYGAPKDTFLNALQGGARNPIGEQVAQMGSTISADLRHTERSLQGLAKQSTVPSTPQYRTLMQDPYADERRAGLDIPLRQQSPQVQNFSKVTAANMKQLTMGIEDSMGEAADAGAKAFQARFKIPDKVKYMTPEERQEWAKLPKEEKYAPVAGGRGGQPPSRIDTPSYSPDRGKSPFPPNNWEAESAYQNRVAPKNLTPAPDVSKMQSIYQRTVQQATQQTVQQITGNAGGGGGLPPVTGPIQPQVPSGGGGPGGGGGAGGTGGGPGGRGGFGFGGGGFDLQRFMEFANPFSGLQLSWQAMMGMGGQMFPAAQSLGEPAMMGGEQAKQGIRGPMAFGSTFTGLPALGKLFNQVSTTDAFELYENMHSSFTVLKNVYKSQEKAAGTIEQSIQLARQTPLEVNDLLKIFSTFSVNPQLRGVLGNREQMGQLATGVSGLSFLVPEQGTQGAIFAIREALAGQYRSLRNRFNINPEIIASAGGMSMTEMKQKPTNFLNALDSFLKQNLGEETFSELQNTFSKQAGNIYDALTGGIFKAFRQTGMYQSVTNFAGELSNLTGNLFESDTFSKFFQDIGGKMNVQFGKATSILKSIDFDTDMPEVVSDKFQKGINAMTKDLVYSLAPNMDKVIGGIAPMAKTVGSTVSNFLSKGIGEIFTNLVGIGAAGIFNTVDTGVKAVVPTEAGKALYQKTISDPMREMATEHPFATIAATAVASKGLTRYISEGVRAEGGVGAFAGSQVGKLGFTPWKAAIGLLSLPALYKQFGEFQTALGPQEDLERAQQTRYRDFQTGRTSLYDYANTAFNESLMGGKKTEKRSLLDSVFSMDTLSSASSLGLVGYSYFRKQQENPNTWVSKMIGGSPLMAIPGNVMTSQQQAASDKNLRGAALAQANNLKWIPATDKGGGRFALPSNEPITPERMKNLQSLIKPLEQQLNSDVVPTGIVTPGVKDKVKGAFNKFSESVGGFFNNTTAQIIDLQKDVPYLTDKYIQSKAKNMQIAPHEVVQSELQKKFPKAQIVGTDSINAAGEHAQQQEARRPGKLKATSIGLGVAAAAGLAAATSFLPERELDIVEQQRLGAVSKGGQTLMALGGAVAPFAPHVGAAMAATGMILDVGSRAWYSLKPESEETKENRSNREKRLSEANKRIHEMNNTIINNQISDVKDFAKAMDYADFMGKDLKATYEQKIDSAVSHEKITATTANKLKTDLPDVAKNIINGYISEEGKNIKDFLVANGVATRDELAKIPEEELKQILDIQKSNYAKQRDPHLVERLRKQGDISITKTMAEMPYLKDFVGKSDVAGANVQQSVQDRMNIMTQQYQQLEKTIALDLYQKGGRKDWKSASEQAQRIVDKVKGTEDVDRAYSDLQQFISMPNEKFMKDKVWNYKETARQIFTPDIMGVGGFDTAIKQYQSVLGDSMNKTMLFFTQPPASQAQTGKDYYGVMPTAFSKMSETMPTFLGSNILATMGSIRTGEARKMFDSAVKDYENIGSTTNKLIEAFKNIVPTELTSSKPIEMASKAGKKASDLIVSAFVENIAVNNPATAYYKEGKKTDEYAKKEAEMRDVLKTSATTKDFDWLLSSLQAKGGTKSTYIDDKGELTEKGKQLKEWYQVADIGTKIDTAKVNMGKLNELPAKDLESVLNRTLSTESAVKLAGSAQMQAEEYQKMFKNVTAYTGYHSQGMREFLGGSWGAGGAQPYAMVNGQVMETSFKFGGQEMPNFGYIAALDEQREQQKLTPETLGTLNEMGTKGADAARARLKTMLNQLEKWDKMGASQFSLMSFASYDKAKEMATAMGVTLDQEDVQKEAILRQKALVQSGQAYDQSVLKSFMAGDTETANQLAQKMGITETKIKEGETPSDKLGGMSSVSDAINILATASENLGKTSSGANEGVSALAKSVGELGENASNIVNGKNEESTKSEPQPQPQPDNTPKIDPLISALGLENQVGAENDPGRKVLKWLGFTPQEKNDEQSIPLPPPTRVEPQKGESKKVENVTEEEAKEQGLKKSGVGFDLKDIWDFFVGDAEAAEIPTDQQDTAKTEQPKTKNLAERIIDSIFGGVTGVSPVDTIKNREEQLQEQITGKPQKRASIWNELFGGIAYATEGEIEQPKEKNWAEQLIDSVFGGVTGVSPVDTIKNREEQLQEQITGKPQKRASLWDTLMGSGEAFAAEIPNEVQTEQPKTKNQAEQIIDSIFESVTGVSPVETIQNRDQQLQQQIQGKFEKRASLQDEMFGSSMAFAAEIPTDQPVDQPKTKNWAEQIIDSIFESVVGVSPVDTIQNRDQQLQEQITGKPQKRASVFNDLLGGTAFAAEGPEDTPQEKNWAEQIIDSIFQSVTGVSPVETIQNRDQQLQDQIKNQTGKRASLFNDLFGGTAYAAEGETEQPQEKNWAEQIIDSIFGGITGVSPVDTIKNREQQLQEQITGKPQKRASLWDSIFGSGEVFAAEMPTDQVSTEQPKEKNQAEQLIDSVFGTVTGVSPVDTIKNREQQLQEQITGKPQKQASIFNDLFGGTAYAAEGLEETPKEKNWAEQLIDSIFGATIGVSPVDTIKNREQQLQEQITGEPQKRASLQDNIFGTNEVLAEDIIKMAPGTGTIEDLSKPVENLPVSKEDEEKSKKTKQENTRYAARYAAQKQFEKEHPVLSTLSNLGNFFSRYSASGMVNMLERSMSPDGKSNTERIRDQIHPFDYDPSEYSENSVGVGVGDMQSIDIAEVGGNMGGVKEPFKVEPFTQNAYDSHERVRLARILDQPEMPMGYYAVPEGKEASIEKQQQNYDTITSLGGEGASKLLQKQMKDPKTHAKYWGEANNAAIEFYHPEIADRRILHEKYVQSMDEGSFHAEPEWYQKQMLQNEKLYKQDQESSPSMQIAKALEDAGGNDIISPPSNTAQGPLGGFSLNGGVNTEGLNQVLGTAANLLGAFASKVQEATQAMGRNTLNAPAKTEGSNTDYPIPTD